MCGIVGLLVKKPALQAQLGALMVPMLIGMTDRGPESAGLAVFGTPVDASERKISVYAGFTEEGSAYNWATFANALGRDLGIEAVASANGNHAVLTVGGDPAAVRNWIKQHHPKLRVLSTGRAIDLYKDVGSPRQVSDRYGFASMTGTHLVGHTRMATESAVTPDRAHPFTAGEDFCLVHNGSLSNAHAIRRTLEPLGIHFDTDNDTEAACRLIEWRLREGDDLEAALQHAFKTLDGFYTLLMGTSDKLALVRDPFACKPAIVAETDDYVAIASEFRSLAHLPGIKNANIFEPGPEEMYVWKA
ncbi:class II glutamine amidotransferase [Verminephrobacter aporrectodeae]|uniref:class II glutamine amidotransferase n=1 Tax=Verminephrobacter aporrectodeae TaxID=1110389 RepID=UPI0022390405|nr:class II glutamine amidotransferase [Verminephrobacter aporrectodeae]MCW5220759.1 amidophosphoribosyltransferase [Verminephrobacter aporrectodeae subsp. tuberculatae]MCW5290054.1 amidophosphoribosyltransferase [Verminephrobacter aporrectodeae subsp. tuberculatae]MCW8176942.1 amidophosphoribosyltransferase [Verminephrobacter aporrectodeae subsp. tuberculatae]MCW8204420.1 amidophosphoribosyltransferase [Verminephrobacter aporrectodeae subsp. tuberculatae]